MKNSSDKTDGRATMLGGIGILLWASTIAFARTISEDLGVIRTGFLVFLGGGLLACAVEISRPGGIKRFLNLSPKHLAVCGPLFVAYMGLLYAAIGSASSREAVVAVGIINYLWPSLVLVLSLVIQNNRARYTFWIGVLLAFGGSIVATADAQNLSWTGFVAHLSSNAFPFLMALGAAMLWGLYSNLSRTLASDSDGNAVPLFLLLTGIVLGVLGAFLDEKQPTWTVRVAWELGYLIIFPTFLAYSFWDLAVQRGNFLVVAAMSYFTPILSTLIAALWLGTSPGVGLWTGCALVTVGAIISRYSIEEHSGS